MSGTRPTPAEHHLGDRLAALIDGELGHDARERVLAHLATCAKCRAEADAQRRVKSLFAESAPPPPPAGLLARLQGLPGGADGGSPFGGPLGVDRLGGDPRGPLPTEEPGSSGPGLFAVRPGGFGYVPADDHVPAPARSGFRIHEVSRPEAERSPWRGRRFAFAAASAVSFAAIALGGAVPTATVVDARGEGSGNSVTPLRSSSAGQPTAAGEGHRRRAAAGAGAGRSVDRPGTTLLPGGQGQARHPAAPPFLHTATPLFASNGVFPIGVTGPAHPPSPKRLAPPVP
ncbi:zf-HC2 domain-containing protein [Streptomyces kanasensis]|uniref:zf-HC2 domain-containing protein n=1 Tax=Streptomyces kanasensis TaxID=936756 RepID=UPI0036F4BE0B